MRLQALASPKRRVPASRVLKNLIATLPLRTK
jgi:hypothetical protein